VTGAQATLIITSGGNDLGIGTGKGWQFGGGIRPAGFRPTRIKPTGLVIWSGVSACRQ
jgi:hypothetical protein